MKKIWCKAAAVLAVTALFSVYLTACSKEEDNTAPAAYSVSQALEEVIEKIKDATGFDKTKAYFIDLGASLSNTGDKKFSYEIDLKGSINAATEGGNKSDFMFTVSDNLSANANVFGLYYDGSNLFYNGDGIGYKFKSGENAQRAATGNLGEIIDLLPVFAPMIFDSVDVSADNQKYVFHYDVNKIIKNLAPMLGGIAGIDWDKLQETLPAIKGQLAFAFIGGALRTVKLTADSDDGRFMYDAHTNNMGTGALSEDIYRYFPEDYESFEEINMLNLNVRGTVNILGGDKKLMSYGYRLLADMNPFNLLSGEIGTEDKLHFTLTNYDSESFTEYTDSRLQDAEGIIAEIAYSPGEFGNANLFAAVNINALLSKQIVTDNNLPDLVLKFIPNYYATIINPSTLLSSLTSGLFGRSKASAAGGKITVGTDAVGNLIGTDILGDLFSTPDTRATDIQITADYVNYGDPTVLGYNVADKYYNEANAETGAKKSFSSADVEYNPAKSATPVYGIADGYIKMFTADGKEVNVEGAKLSTVEVKALKGGLIEYAYEGFDGAQGNAAVGIVDVKGIDYSIIDKEQEITVITAPTDGQNLLLMATAFGIKLPLPANEFKTKIVLTDESSSDIVRTEREYRVGDAISNVYAEGLKITYKDGSEYNYNLDNPSPRHDIPFYKVGYTGYLAMSGEFTVSYDVAGRTVKDRITVLPPDSVEIIWNENVFLAGTAADGAAYGRIEARYGEQTVNIAINYADLKFPAGAVTNGVFTEKGSYLVRYDMFGMNEVTRVYVN